MPYFLVSRVALDYGITPLANLGASAINGYFSATILRFDLLRDDHDLRELRVIRCSEIHLNWG